MDNNITLNPPARPPYMASIAEENKWLIATNEYEEATATERGDTHYLKGMRTVSPYSAIIWWIKEAATNRFIDGFETRDEALKALDAMEVK